MSLVLGWGALSYETGQYPDVLMEVEMGVVTNEVCSASTGNDINDNMICAGGWWDRTVARETLAVL